MNQNLKKIIIIIAIICILMIILLCFLINHQRKIIGNTTLTEDETPLAAYDIEKNKVQLVQLRSDFYLVQDCIEKFYTSEDVKKIYNRLDYEYIADFNITENNLNNKFKTYKKVEVDISKIYLIEINTGINAYLVKGYLRDAETNNVIAITIGIKTDNNNNTFSVLPYEYLEKKNYLNINVGDTLDFNAIEQIKNNIDNTFKYEYINDEGHMMNLFTTYINRCLYNVELAYDSLNTEYKEKRFENLQEFKNYVSNNKKLYLSQDMSTTKQYGDFDSMEEYLLYLASVKSLELEKYQVIKQNNYTQYVCIDNYNNYYIFREMSGMNYDLILDTYTVDLPEFVEKYNEAEEDEKILLNIQKIFEAINAGDYKYVYDKLDNTFKSNYFKTRLEFENYIKKHLYTNNKINYGDCQKNGEVYIYKIQIEDGDKLKTEIIDKKIVMKLLEGTNFVFSFNVE